MEIEYVYDISIVMSYFNFRLEQTLNTLRNFNIYKKYNFEVVLIDDNTTDEYKIEKYLDEFKYPIQYKYITKEEKGDRVNSCCAYNIGFQMAKGKIIIIQNPECYHIGDILGYCLFNLNENDYFAFSAFNCSDNLIFDEIINNDKLVFDNLLILRNQNHKNNSLKLNWYNHPQYRPVNYHFCSAIHKTKLNIIGGFDEIYANGIGFDDDDFVKSVSSNGLNIICIDPTKYYVIHQYHINLYNCENNINMFKKNRDIYEKKYNCANYNLSNSNKFRKGNKFNR